MNNRNQRILSVMILAAILAGCSVPDSGSDPYAGSGHGGGNHAASAVTITGPLKVTAYGPKHFKAGVPFHQQAGGDSALWLRLDKSMNGADVSIYFDGNPLHTAIKGDTLTALVPPALIAKAGTHMLWMQVKNPDGKTLASDKVEMLAN